MKTGTLYASLCIATFSLLACWTTLPPIDGLWQSTEGSGSIEFKPNGEVTVVDNMSATVAGYYSLEGDDTIRIEITASDILRDSIAPTAKTVITARIVEYDGDELRLRVAGEDGTEHYRRVRSLAPPR